MMNITTEILSEVQDIKEDLLQQPFEKRKIIMFQFKKTITFLIKEMTSDTKDYTSTVKEKYEEVKASGTSYEDYILEVSSQSKRLAEQLKELDTELGFEGIISFTRIIGEFQYLIITYMLDLYGHIFSVNDLVRLNDYGKYLLEIFELENKGEK